MGERVLEFDFPGLEIGTAEYEDGPTGCTVFHFTGGGLPFVADVRGGSPGTIMADAGFAQAICFAGGSLMGLEAATGVAAALYDRRGQERVRWQDVPLVAGAIVFDFGNRANGVYPDKALGAAALTAAQPGRFPLGRSGAGRNTSVGKVGSGSRPEACGQGAAIRSEGPVKVAVFTVVNAMGSIVDRSGRVVRGKRAPAAVTAPEPGNTTLTFVMTNQKIGGRALDQFARQVHASMARCIQPFHTEFDGDVLFVASTNEVDHPPLASSAALGMLASEVAWDAVLASFDPD
jgi:L-aminopeptidase/D-esterase-like protein